MRVGVLVVLVVCFWVAVALLGFRGCIVTIVFGGLL